MSKRMRQEEAVGGRVRGAWIGLFAVIIALGIVCGLAHPLGLAPDEAAHAKYVKFLALEGRLPFWIPDGGGEGGYEAQHPPLYYALGAVVYRCASGLPENWRWQLLRWYSLLIGIVALWCARGFLIDYFRGKMGPALVATAAFGLTPLTLEYMSYINPDVMSVLWCCIVLWMSVRVARGEAAPRDRVVLVVALGLGLLTKLTVLGVVPVVIAAYLWEPYPECERKWERRRLLLLVTVLGASLICGWWYFRNGLLYHAIVIHTTGQLGSGLDQVRVYGQTGGLLRITLTNTYVSTWIERSWLPPYWWGLAFIALITFCLIAAAVSAVVRAKRGREASADPVAWLCGLLVASLFVFHQAQVWFVDYEFNAGGRYLLNGLVAIHALVVGSFAATRFRKVWFGVWIGIFALLSAISLYGLTVVAVPGWRPLVLTVPYK